MEGMELNGTRQHVSLWSVLIMLIYWEKIYIL